MDFFFHLNFKPVKLLKVVVTLNKTSLLIDDIK